MKKRSWLMIAIGLTLALLLTGCVENGVISAGNDAPADSSTDGATGTWPTGTVTLYVPAAAGGTTDTAARLFADNWGAQTGQQFLVVNERAGNGGVACEAVRNSKPDGLNLLFYNTSLCGTISTGQYEYGFDDFTVLGVFLDSSPESTCILVNAESEFQTLDDLIQYAKEHPGELIWGGQVYARSHFVGILIQDQIGFSTTHVDAGSAAETLTQLLGKNIDMACIGTASVPQYVESGDLRALSINGSQKSELLPEVPTLAELGYTPVDLPSLHFLLGPAGMSQGDIENITKMLKTSSEDEAIRETMKAAGQTVVYMTPEESHETLNAIQADFDKAYEIILNLGE